MVCLTFDLEERFHSHLTPSNSPREWNLHNSITRIIDWLEEHNKKATFFIVGELAEHYPHLIQRIFQAGCEIASHSYQHIRFDETRVEFCKEDISKSKKVLEDIIGSPVYGFRSPSWSVKIADNWFWDYLISLGFCYDSSLFPFRTHMYGSFKNQPKPFWIRSEILEIPPSVHLIGPIRIPYGGGFYFRFYPTFLTKYFIDYNINAGRIPILYFHPWDFESAPDFLERSYLNRFIGNYNVKKAWKKFDVLLDGLKTITAHKYLIRILNKSSSREDE